MPRTFTQPRHTRPYLMPLNSSALRERRARSCMPTRIRDSVVTMGERPSIDGLSGSTHVYVPNVDETYRRALEAARRASRHQGTFGMGTVAPAFETLKVICGGRGLTSVQPSNSFKPGRFADR